MRPSANYFQSIQLRSQVHNSPFQNTGLTQPNAGYSSPSYYCIDFWPCCADQSNFQQSQISVNLYNAVKPKASSSSDQYSRSRIDYASSKYTQARSKSSLDKGNQFHFTNDQDYAITLQPESRTIPIWQIQATPVHLSTNGHVCGGSLSADDCRHAQSVPL
jgi:hypothetical protein